MSGLRRLLGALAVLPALALAAPAQGSLTPVSGPHPAGPSLAGTLSGVVTVSEKQIAVTVSYSGANDEAWARSVLGGVESGLPALVKATGYPYPGPGSIRIDQRTEEDIHGYAGSAACNISYCRIRLTTTSGELTLLHELAHLWTQPFEKRWLSEGYAEYASMEAAALLGLTSKPVFAGYGVGTPSIPLSEWDHPINLLTAGGEEIVAEYEGYDYSYQLFLLLEDAAGAENLTAANAILFSEQTPYTVGSRLYMDTLEDVSGVNLDDVFVRWVLGDGTAALVAQRREARDRLASLRAQAEPLGLAVNESIQEHIEKWEFDEALDILARNEANLAVYAEMTAALDALRPEIERAGLPYPRAFDEAAETWDFGDIRDALPDARAAVEAYEEAKRVAEADRGLWRQAGLLLRSPEGKLQHAADNFAAGLFGQSVEDSHAAQGMVEGAGHAALIRVLVALALLGSAGVAGLIWLLREEPLVSDQSPR